MSESQDQILDGHGSRLVNCVNLTREHQRHNVPKNLRSIRSQNRALTFRPILDFKKNWPCLTA